MSVCLADPDVNPFFAIREIKAIERRKNRHSILGKRKRAMDGEAKARVEAKVGALKACSVLKNSTTHNGPVPIKKRRVSSDLSISCTFVTPLMDKRASRHACSS
jgi:ribosome-binding factor A